jgi:hypothetical protein
MKYFFAFLLCLGAAALCEAQSVGIGTTTPNSSAQLDITSTSQGLLIPRMTTTAVHAISNPARGLLIYDTVQNQLMVNMGTATTPNWQTIVANSGWSLTGNTGTNPPTQFIGTTDATPLFLGVNGRVGGMVDSTSGNVALGYRAGEYAAFNYNSDQLAGNNTAIGYKALMNNQVYNNVAVGQAAMQNNTGGTYCVGVGEGALYSNTTGVNNTAVGTSAAATNTTGNALTAFGYNALNRNTTGSEIDAFGDYALFENTTGTQNTAGGSQAMYSNTTGSQNAAFGAFAMNQNIGGQNNVAVGYLALANTTNSDYNTVVGANSAIAFDNGYNNVFVGANNDVNGPGYYNVIAIGQGVICTAPSQARFGNSATNSIGGYANWTNFSDVRYKKNIKDDVKGLDFIMRLKPITYNLDVTGIRTHLGQKAPADANTRQSIATREREVISGFAAQDVEAAAAASGYNFSGVDKPKNENDFYGLRYGDFVVPLVKAVQEQQAMIKALQDEVTELENQTRQSPKK